MGKLKNCVAIVTGGGRGLGKAFCLAMAQEGAMVVVVDILGEDARRTSEEIRTKGFSSLELEVDVTKEADTLSMAEETLKQFGRIDILVNNAGMLYGITKKPFTEIPPDEWDRLMTVNLKGPFLCTRAVFPQMKKQGRGKIVNISSEVAFTGVGQHMLHYVTSKAGVIGFTRCLAAEIGPLGVLVNAIAPGLIETEGSRTLWDDIGQYDTSITPLRRLGEPDDLIGAVIFLSSVDSDFITGQTLLVNGGRFMH